MEEQKGFYTKAIDDENSVQISTPIDGYEMNENVSCTKCKFYKHHYGDNWVDWEECRHVENNYYTYDHKGKHKHRIWEPYDKNKKLDCELYEEKVSIFRKIKIKLGIK